MFIDVGNYNIFSPVIFFHFIVTLLLTVALSYHSPSRKTFLSSCLHALTIAPTITLIVFFAQIPFFHVFFYISFLVSLILAIQFILLIYANYDLQLFYFFVTLVFLWGTNLVIESLTFLYDILAPLSISYHYSLVAEGILHIGTILYIIFLPLFFYGISHAKTS
tara:strand:- start:4557 stop:5048 length:492 start_codon:yes stop_codon:yes gene_type:complete